MLCEDKITLSVHLFDFKVHTMHSVDAVLWCCCYNVRLFVFTLQPSVEEKHKRAAKGVCRQLL